MTFKEKRYNKKVAKMYFVAAYAMVALFVILIMGILILGTRENYEPNVPPIIGVIIVFLPCFVGLVFAFVGQYYLNKRLRYKGAIKRFRQWTFFQKTLDLLLADKYNAAVNVYDKLITKGDHKDFLFGFGIAMALHSKEDNRSEIGHKRLQDIRKCFDPGDIKFE